MTTIMLKKPSCKHQWEDVHQCQPAFSNEYECPCGNAWTDEWSCGCDDDCGACGTTCSPTRSTDVAPCACNHFND